MMTIRDCDTLVRQKHDIYLLFILYAIEIVHKWSVAYNIGREHYEYIMFIGLKKLSQ